MTEGRGVPTALDFPECRKCAAWEDAGASWPRPCKEHYGGEPGRSPSPHEHEYREVYVGGRDGKEHVWQCACGATGIVAPWSDWTPPTTAPARVQTPGGTS